ncbi:MAG TPA: undecaprenyl diphosphate synthase family protein [Patescibacteria group bacterium]|jgi:undecaprenyl diphosphate synthase|nr:undecaprenyl diphosphate synthase family protein [Patescibacteria group bacterium]
MSKQVSYLKHVSFIPDGNRRWAAQHGILNEKKVYDQGSDIASDIAQAAFEAGADCVSFWAGSYNNIIKRPKGFVGGLEDAYVRLFNKLATHPLIHEKQVRVEAPGEWRDILRPDTQTAINEALETTKNYSAKRLIILLGYDGTRERGAAVQSLLSDQQSVPKNIQEAADLLRQHSWTGDLPDVDLIVRTGAWQDPHISAGFLSLISSESQLAFPQVLWPDLTPAILKEILDDFSNRERRLGR